MCGGSCLEGIGHAALQQGDELAGGGAGHTEDFAGEVGLVGVAGVRGHGGQVELGRSSGKAEEALEAEDAIESFESVTEGLEAAAAEGALAEAEMGCQVIEPESRRHAAVAGSATEESEEGVGGSDGREFGDEEVFEGGCP